MQIEHLGMNIKDAQAMVAWYREHLEMPIHVERTDPIYVAFFGEAPSLLEVYDNPEHPYLKMEGNTPLTFHIAFFSQDLSKDRERLVKAGARHIDGEPDEEGYGLVMLQCPWGLAIQLCHRKTPLMLNH